MYELAGTPEQDAFAELARDWTAFKFLAARYQQMRQELRNAVGRGAPASTTRALTDQVDSLERDYKAARARVTETREGRLQLSNFTAQGMVAVWRALFRRTELLEDKVTDVRQEYPPRTPEPTEPRPGILENVGEITKWAVIGGAVYLVAQLTKGMR